MSLASLPFYQVGDTGIVFIISISFVLLEEIVFQSVKWI